MSTDKPKTYADAAYQRKRRAAINDGTWVPKNKGGGKKLDPAEVPDLSVRQKLLMGPVFSEHESRDAANREMRAVWGNVHQVKWKIKCRTYPAVCPERNVAVFILRIDLISQGDDTSQ